MKVLLVSYALSPSRGSEGATGWGWATGLARLHDVTVVSRRQEQEEVETYFAAHPHQKLNVKWIKSGAYRGPKAALVNYLWWIRNAVKECKVLSDRQSFDVVQFVSLGSISAPVHLWKLGIPFVLGPVGGGQTLNPMYQQVLGKMPWPARIRNFRIALLPYSPSTRKMMRKASLVLATNKETGQVASRCGARTLPFSATGTKEDFLLREPPRKERKPGLRMLWTGRMLYRKGLPLVLHALKAAGRSDFMLDLLGNGPMEPLLRALVKELGLATQVIFHEPVPFHRVFDFYDRADLFVFPSVNDSFGSQLLEASGRGLPILTLNHQGADTLVPDSVAWKVSVDTVSHTIEEMTEAMITLAASPRRLAAMSWAALAYAQTESWPRRVDRMSVIYEQLVRDAQLKRSA